MFLLEYFHLVGLLIHFKNDLLLSDAIFINPAWITKPLNLMLNDQHIRQANGAFERSWLVEFLQNQNLNNSEIAYLINLILKDNFDLCVVLDSSNEKFLYPKWLPIKPVELNWDDGIECVELYIKYPSHPIGVINRLIVRLFNLIESDNYWNNGLEISNANCNALIELYPNGVLSVRIAGGHSQDRMNLQAVIRNSIHEINVKYLKNIDFMEFVPCKCPDCEKLSLFSKTTFEYNLLRRCYKEGRAKLICDKNPEKIKDVYVAELIGREISSMGVRKFEENEKILNFLGGY